MGCACGNARRAAVAKAAGQSFVYDFTAPGADTPITYGSPVEAKAAVRRAGGGTVRRRTVNTTA